MIQRYFRSSPAVYVAVLDDINAAWGLPANGQESAFAPVESAPQAGGLVYLAVWDFFCEYEAVAAVLPSLLASGQVEEIDRQAYLDALPAVDQ